MLPLLLPMPPPPPLLLPMPPPPPLLLLLLLLAMPALASTVLSSRPLLQLRQVLHSVTYFLARVLLHFYCEGWIHLSMPQLK